MPRPQEFDTTQALERAMDLFWLRGYEATSLQELIEHMGIGRQSLYNTFGDKRSLFLAALDHYCHKHSDGLQRLQHEAAGLEQIHEHFDDVIKICCTPGTRRACLIANTAMELAPHDEEIARWVKSRVQILVDAFHNTVTNAQRNGEIAEQEDTKAVAYHLVTTTLGLGVLAKGGVSKRMLHEIKSVALSVLERAETTGRSR